MPTNTPNKPNAQQPLFNSVYQFPDPPSADPDGLGLIAIGGDLAPSTLLDAYSQGLFPWFNEDEPIAWWCPEPRCVLDPTTFKPSKSLRKLCKSSSWQWTVNVAFEDVIHACSLPRSYANDTWIHEEMIEAYNQIHELGYAHSIEIWEDDQLIGGLYGLKIGQIYFGESMFYRKSNASKVAFWALNILCEASQVQLIDCQLPNDHLQSLGASIMPRNIFLNKLSDLVSQDSFDWHHLSGQSFDVLSLVDSSLIPSYFTDDLSLTFKGT